MTEQELMAIRKRRESAYFHTLFRRRSMLAEKAERQLRIMRKELKKKTA